MTPQFSIRPLLTTTLALAALLAFPAAQAANLAKADYDAGKTRLSADYKTEKAACASMTANAKDICVEEAKAHEKVGRANLEFGLSGKQRDYTKLQEVKASTAYKVARERCDDKGGNDKDVCIKEAKAIEAKAMAAAKHDKVVVDASKDEMTTRQKADYKVAAEKCDALAGDAKASCVTAAKQKYNQS